VLLLLVLVVSMVRSDLSMVMVLLMIMLLRLLLLLLLLLLLRMGVHLLRLLTLMLMLLLLLLLIMKGQLLLLRHQERVERVEIVGGVVLHIITWNYKREGGGAKGGIDGGRGSKGVALNQERRIDASKE
jgi:uncharacterized protein (DUF58 family)